ncbi:MAG: Uma2 family endonuclease [Acidobacteria bacterium]|nr:Uma2 family endonuclease [Acidobacteriota bacterium]
MGTQTAISLEQYWQTRWEYPPEYVHGELVERPMPTRKHGIISGLMQYRLHMLLAAFGGWAGVGVHCRLQGDILRIPDVVAYGPGGNDDPYPSAPPLAVIEINSPGDAFSDIVAKCREYHRWGAQHIWVIDPQTNDLYSFNGNHLQGTDVLRLPEYNAQFSAQEIFGE